MVPAVASISSLLLGMGILLSGNGLLGLLVGLRGASEGFSELMLGLIMSGFYLGYIIGAMVCPAVIRHVGHIRAFTVFAAGSAVAALAYGLLVHPVAWWAFRIISGLLLLGLYMAIESWLSERSTEHRGEIFSIYVAITLVALGCGQYLLLVYGISGLASFALVAGLFCLGLIPVALTPVAQPEPIRTERLTIRRLYAVTPVGAGGALCSGLVLGSFWALASVYGLSLGLSTADIASFIVVAIAGGAVLQWPVGWLSDRYDRRAVLVLVCLAGAVAVVMMLGGLRTGWVGLLIAAFAFGGFAFSVYGLAVAQTHDRFLSHEALEATRALLLLHGIGASIGPILTGALMTQAAGGFAISLLISLLGMAVFTGWRILIDPPVPALDRTPYTPLDQTSPLASELDPRTPAADSSPELSEILTPDVADLPAATS